jgi:hypothetical protein
VVSRPDDFDYLEELDSDKDPPIYDPNEDVGRWRYLTPYDENLAHTRLDQQIPGMPAHPSAEDVQRYRFQWDAAMWLDEFTRDVNIVPVRAVVSEDDEDEDDKDEDDDDEDQDDEEADEKADEGENEEAAEQNDEAAEEDAEEAAEKDDEGEDEGEDDEKDIDADGHHEDRALTPTLSAAQWVDRTDSSRPGHWRFDTDGDELRAAAQLGSLPGMTLMPSAREIQWYYRRELRAGRSAALVDGINYSFVNNTQVGEPVEPYY